MLRTAATFLREQRVGAGTVELPDDNVSLSVPGDSITIFIQDIDDEIKEETVTWNDVLAMSDGEEGVGTQEDNIFSN